MPYSHICANCPLWTLDPMDPFPLSKGIKELNHLEKRKMVVEKFVLEQTAAKYYFFKN